MRKIATWITLLALSSTSSAIINPNLKPSFADLTWYSSSQDVKAKMKARGYEFFKNDSSGNAGATDSIYSGKLLGLKARVEHLFNNKNQLVKTSVVFNNSTYVFSSGNVYSEWKLVKSALEAKYGKGTDLSTLEQQEHYSNSSLEDKLNSGKTLNTVWYFPTHDYYISLKVDKAYVNDDDYYTNLGYESPAWSKELKRRQQDGDL